MEEATMNAGEDRLKVSFTARLIALAAFTIPLIGGALSSFLMFGSFRALQANESAGVAAVMAALKEASLPVIVSLYLAAFFAFVVVLVLVVRIFIQTKKASPPFWYFILGGILCLISAGSFWKAKLLVLDVLSPGSSAAANGIAGIAAEMLREPRLPNGPQAVARLVERAAAASRPAAHQPGVPAMRLRQQRDHHAALAVPPRAVWNLDALQSLIKELYG